nr:unnamed protein product [Spirometra erinaceieuropaei]
MLGIRTALKPDLECSAAELVYGTALRIPDSVRRPLQQPYDGPFRVLSRKGKHFTIDRGGRTDVVSIDHLKAAYTEPLPTSPTEQPPLGTLPLTISQTPFTPNNPASSLIPQTPPITRSGRHATTIFATDEDIQEGQLIVFLLVHRKLNVREDGVELFFESQHLIPFDDDKGVIHIPSPEFRSVVSEKPATPAVEGPPRL